MIILNCNHDAIMKAEMNLKTNWDKFQKIFNITFCLNTILKTNVYIDNAMLFLTKGIKSCAESAHPVLQISEKNQKKTAKTSKRKKN